jgi:exonuclease VII large subunit
MIKIPESKTLKNKNNGLINKKFKIFQSHEILDQKNKFAKIKEKLNNKRRKEALYSYNEKKLNTAANLLNNAELKIFCNEKTKETNFKTKLYLINKEQDLKNKEQDLKNKEQDLKNKEQDLKNKEQDLKNINFMHTTSRFYQNLKD